MTETHTNRLAHETSPYLLQHAHNPVDWYPWGDEAFQKARTEDRPIFLSIGYSACHWCHVMEHESFENEETAALLNQNFVAIKVDREERPDVDSIYMQAVQMMTGHGGWPMSVFLTPDGSPFYGGTYFPPADRHGLPSFRRVLGHVANIWSAKRDTVDSAAGEIRAALSTRVVEPDDSVALSPETLVWATRRMLEGYDAIHGGFGQAPKFPPAMTLAFLLRVTTRAPSDEMNEVIRTTLHHMAHGGLYDQVGGGFHRYSTDERWLVPHFEKMLYDNALLARLYIDAWRWSGNPLHARIASETLGFVARELMSPAGGFYSTLDADSEGVEGKFYVWQRAEILEILGEEEGKLFCTLYDINEKGNWEGVSIPNIPSDLELIAKENGLTLEQLTDIASRGKCKLYGARESRIRPGRDEKVLAGWNGWMLVAFAEGALAFRRDDLLEIVRQNADFLIDTMMDGSRIFRSWKDGKRKIPGMLEDYAGAGCGLVAAFEATQDRRYLDAARMLAREILDRFRDPDNGSFFDTPVDHEPLITRPKDLFDNATPSGNSLAIDLLFRLAAYYGDEELETAAVTALDAVWGTALRFPTGFGHLLCAADWSMMRPLEIVVTGSTDDPAQQALWKTVGESWLPHRILCTSEAGDLPLLEGRSADRVAAYVCERYVCLQPATTPEELLDRLAQKPDNM